VDSVVATAVVERPDAHADIEGRANTMTVMAPKGGDDEMLFLRLQAREPRLDRQVCDGDVAHPNRAIKQRDVACDAELPTARQLSDSREETPKDRNVPLINRIARVPHEGQTDGGFSANAAHHGDPHRHRSSLRYSRRPFGSSRSPRLMCPIWDSRGSGNNR